MLLAETNPADLSDPAFLSFVKGLFIFVSVVTNIGLGLRVIAGKKDQVNISPQPFEVSKAKSFTTTEEFAVLKKQVEALSAKRDDDYRKLMEAGARREESIKESIHSMKDHLSEKLDQSLKETYHRINNQGERLAAVEAKTGVNQKRPRD